MSHEKRKKKAKKVYPSQETSEDEGLVNDGYEMDDMDNNAINNRITKFRSLAEKISVSNPLNLIANVKQGISKWKHYSNTRRSILSSEDSGLDRRNTGGIGLADELGETKDLTDGEKPLKNTDRQYIIAKNRNLIQYFAQLGKHCEQETKVDLEFLDKLLKDGARVNTTDKYGQTCLHEVARSWHVDVAQFLLEHGGNVNQGDNYGRTPLHIAAAVDYPDMCQFLIKHAANREAQTKTEHQTPVHFASKNDACLSLKMLIKLGCKYQSVMDYKGRTPLHLAAELDRSETARVLLECNDPAPAGVEDHSGQAAIVWMITKMPPVAKLALDQFHTTDRANRRQYFHLHHLEPRKPEDPREGNPSTALQAAVTYRRFDLIIHPVFIELISVKWNRFARLGAWVNTIMNFLFIVLWTIQGILVEYDERYKYIMPGHWWRIVLFILALGLTGWQIKDELMEFFHSKRAHKAWKEWRQAEIEKDIDFAHPRWPEEEQYLRQEINDLDKIRPQYFNDFWNIFDWIVYTLLLTCVITHLVDIWAHTELVARLHIRIMAITIILVWLRLMKNARAYSTLGPFIVMLSHMVADIIKFLFLYLEFYIPFACAFWMIFGGDKVPESKQGAPDAHNHTMTVSGYGNPSALLFSMFRLTLVDDYDYDGMKQVDSIMADILVGTWLALSAILCLNLFIALLSDTFQRVYDNAQANAVMQKAITILSLEEGLNRKRRERFRKFIHSNCAPKVDFYDDDTTELGEEDLKKVTIQIKEDMDDLRDKLDQHYSTRDDTRGGGGSTGGGSNQKYLSTSKFDTEVTHLRGEMQDIKDRQEDMMDRLQADMETVKSMLQGLMGQGSQGRDYDHVSRPSSKGSRRGRLAGTMPEPSLPPITDTMGSYGRPAVDTMGSYGRPAGDTMGSYRRPMDDTMTTQRPRSRSRKRDSQDDTDWERSERQRKKELKKLKQQLAQTPPQQVVHSSDQESDVIMDSTYKSEPLVEVSEFKPRSLTTQVVKETEQETTAIPKVKVKSTRERDGRHSSDA